MRYQLPALLLLAIFVLLMQNPTPWAQSHALHTETADPPWDPFAPSALQQLNCNPSQPASCRYAAQVELAPRTPPGFWGMKIDLASPTNLFEGGIDFGGALAANALKEAYLRFRIDNPQQQPQIVVLEIEAQFTRADFPSRLGIEAQLFSLQAGETRIPAGERLRSTPGSAANLQWLRTSALLIPGDYLLVLNTAAGSAWATFQAQM
jgi:hypothetical protein